MSGDDDHIEKLQQRIEAATDDDEKERLQDTLAEFQGRSLSGVGHNRDQGDDGTS